MKTDKYKRQFEITRQNKLKRIKKEIKKQAKNGHEYKYIEPK